LYLGPLDYDIVKEYGMASTVNFGWKWLVRPIGEFFMLPVFTTIYKFLPNFGVAIIVFSLLMKLLLYPLSIGQIQSAQKMKVLQPEVEKLRKKFADDPTGMQQAQMKLFGEYGINPMGGCLPLLLQMPILYALYSVLTSNIHMRQAMFVQGWIPDLSVPDYILTLPFSVLGVHALSGMALIMGITMFVQQKMTVTDPSQKAMVYMMPVMMTMMFSNLPSGLNLYYLTFNFLGIAQQVYMTKFSKSKITLEDLKRMPKKESWLQKRLQMAQELAEAQGRMPQQQKRAPKRSKK
jgi:YidC/Oxa1 family membrane protein insertase